MEIEDANSERKKRPGYLTAYANRAGITKTAVAEQLKRVGIDYLQPFDFAEADRLRAAARHADRAKFAKPIYVTPGEDPLGLESCDDDPDVPANSTIAEHQSKKEEFRAKLVELQYEELVGTLVRKEKVEKEAFRRGRLVRDAVLNVPSRLAGILAAESDQRKVHDLLEKELRQVLEVLAIEDEDAGKPEQSRGGGDER